MKILVLGSGADGGVPQWNCSCLACRACREASQPALKPQPQRSQSSVAVSQDGLSWVLLNAAPDITQQIRANPQLQPRAAVEKVEKAAKASPDTDLHSPIKALVLLDGQWQSVGGLLNLRDRAGLEVYATPPVFEDLTESLSQRFGFESRDTVRWHLLPVAGSQTQAEFRIPGFGGLRFVAFAVPGAVPGADSVGQRIAVAVEDLASRRVFVYAPDLPTPSDVTELNAEPEPELAWLQDAACLLVDGSAEWPNHGLAGRRISTHLSHHSRWLNEHAGADRQLAADGCELAFDGMVIEV
jgi:pyrroloquinoline quinone biosynthesis protein B